MELLFSGQTDGKNKRIYNESVTDGSVFFFFFLGKYAVSAEFE